MSTKYCTTNYFGDTLMKWAKFWDKKQKDEEEALNLDDLVQMNLKEYLHTNPLTQHLILSPQGNMRFHWGDWAQSCNFQKSLVGNLESTMRIQELESSLEELKMQPVWVNNRVKTLKLTLYDLYRSYLDARVREVWFRDDKQVFMVSLTHETGPFVPLNSLRWFDKKIYARFVYHKILHDHQGGHHRTFRLNLDSPIVCHFENNLIDASHIYIHQITRGGVLLKVVGQDVFNRLLVSRQVRVELDAKILQRLGKAKDMGEFKRIVAGESCDLTLSNKRKIYSINMREVALKYRNLDNFKQSNTRDFYVFVGCEHFQFEGKGDESINDIVSYFMGSAELMFTKEMDKIA